MNAFKSNLVIVVASLLLIFSSCRNETVKVNEEVIVPVTADFITLSSIQEVINTTGTVNSVSQVELSSEMAGKYKVSINPATKKPYSLGDKVIKGASIITFSDKEYENGVKIETVKLSLDIAKRDFEKQKSVYEKGGITLTELNNAEVAAINSEYSYENAKLALEKMKIVAPFTGIITEMPFFTENVKLASGTLVVKLMDYSEMYMDISLPEKDINEIKVDLNVDIMNYTLPDDTIKGYINQLSPAISAETRTFTGLVKINNPDLLLRPGMFVKADIVTQRSDSSIVISKDLLMKGRRGYYVYVVEKNTAVYKTVALGLETDTEVEIVSGLAINDRIVISGFETLQNNSKVKVIQ